MPPRRSVRLSALLIPAVLGLGAPALAAAAPDPVYAALRAMRPDGRSLPVHGLVLERDAFRFQLDSGALHFLSPVEGRTVGAVFVGRGSYRLAPATEGERRHLALAAGAGKEFETLSDTFAELVLLFGDDTAAEAQLHAPVAAGAPDPRAVAAWEGHLKRQRKEFKTNFHLRLLADLLNTPGLTSGVFLAFVDGESYPPAVAALDPNGAEAIGLGSLGGEDAVFFVQDMNRGGAWYLADPVGEVRSGRRSPAKRLADALHYRIETEVAKDADLSGTTTVLLQALVPGLRVLPLHLAPELRIRAADFAPEAEEAWTPVAYVQEPEKEDADAAVVFPRPLAKQEKVRLRLAYAGEKILKDMGEKNFAVGARASWYPNLGVFTDPATFELVYRVPAGNEVVSVGERVETRNEGGKSVSVWRAEQPAQVAGFNYGKFKRVDRTDETSGIEVEVFTNPGTPNAIRGINDFLESSQPRGFDEEGDVRGTGFAPSLGKVDTSRLAESALVDGVNSARLFTTYFGPLPQRHVAITQQSEWSFGQSWPSLIFLPYLSFLDGTQRQRLGLNQAKDFVDNVGYHEFAHQWWGHLVGWDSYRDQWLSEGFAEFSAALALQHTQGWGAYDHFWREARKTILAKYPGNAVAHWEAGPIRDGWRLSTQRSPSAAFAMIYEKGGYVLHMLRMLMWNGAAPNPDANFIAMMKDFTAAYAGKSATTADFQKVVERHMVPSMDATRDGKMDWFFRQWVDGTEIPRYESDLKVDRAGDRWRISGTVRQREVGKDFRAVVPLYVELEKNRFAQVGLVPMAGEASVPVDLTLELPKKPRRALANARGEVLARD